MFLSNNDCFDRKAVAMYFISFLKQYGPFIVDSLTSTLGKDAEVWLATTDRQSKVTLEDPKLAELVSSEVQESRWLLHGLPLAGRPAEIPDFGRLTTLDAIDLAFANLAEKYSWAAFPYGGHGNLGLFGFVSMRGEISELLLSAAGRGLSLPWDPSRHDDMIVATYAVNDKFSDRCRNVIFSERTCGQALWNSERLFQNPPLVLSVSPQAIEFLTDQILSDRDDLEIIGPASGAPDPTKPWLYRPKTLDALVELGKCPESLSLLPGNAPQATVETVTRLQSETDAFGYLSGLRIALLAAEWIYSTRRGHTDDQYSVFSAREPFRINRLIEAIGYIEDEIVAVF
jgi:hypothetical protein